MPAADDWRRMGQEQYLPGVTLTWKRYQALRADWEHEHCVFCFHKFLDPAYSPSHAETLRDKPDDCSDAGYTNVGEPDRPAGEWWICAQCFADFNDEFGWHVVETEPDAWPYRTAEPTSRPTAADYLGSGPQKGPLHRPDQET